MAKRESRGSALNAPGRNLYGQETSAMRVYLNDGEAKRLVGTADISPDHGPVYEARLFGAASVMTDQFTIGTITHLPTGGGVPVVERIVVLAPHQVPSLLPRWQPLAS